MYIFSLFYIDILVFQVTLKDEIQTAPASPPLPQFQAILKYKKNKLALVPILTNSAVAQGLCSSCQMSI